ncbi:hypothetical protein PGTUg99_009372 [Puccinia graminis f. sp. tritici]|uniref:Uncharacterized protein n=1 Tax=Puccinia graminis f. sp. tritici TaxID=56615 RepID=A0A5B0NBI8_PUCGR|nr:hypothetical protein PGTUg99_009372 [Puccinia graminis f. sp. tritici]
MKMAQGRWSPRGCRIWRKKLSNPFKQGKMETKNLHSSILVQRDPIVQPNCMCWRKPFNATHSALVFFLPLILCHDIF